MYIIPKDCTSPGATRSLPILLLKKRRAGGIRSQALLGYKQYRKPARLILYLSTYLLPYCMHGLKRHGRSNQIGVHVASEKRRLALGCQMGV